MSGTRRFGLFVPDEDPSGNQVTTRAQKLQLLSHGRCRLAHMLTPQSITGALVAPSDTRHTIPERSGVDAPSCYILVTRRAPRQTTLGRSQPDGWDSAHFLSSVLPSRTPKGQTLYRALRGRKPLGVEYVKRWASLCNLASGIEIFPTNHQTLKRKKLC